MKAVLRRKVATIGIVSALLLAACSGGTPETPQDNAATGSSDPGDAESLLIGFALPVLANPFWRSEADFAQYVGSELGNVEVVLADAESDENKQLQQVESLISQGVDGIIASPVTQAVGPALLSAAEKAGIPIVFAERNPGVQPDEYDGDSYVGFVGADGTQGAMQTAQALYDAGARKVVAVAGKQGSSVTDERIGGLQKFAEEHSDFEILQIQYDVELQADGVSAIENFLSAYPGPGFDGVWAYNDEGALGAVEAIRRVDALGDVHITGFDGTADATTAIIEGRALATSGGQFVDGGLALIMLYDAIHGFAPKERWLELDYLLIDPSNAEAYQEQFVKSTPTYDVRNLSQVFNTSASTDDYAIALAD